MPTITSHSQTRSVSIAADPGAVLEFVADPYQLPVWAPDFAESVRREDDHWVVSTRRGETSILVCANPEQGTVDLLSAADPGSGAFTRILPNGDGSEYLFTLFFPEGTPESAIDGQMAVVEGELRTVRAQCERARAHAH
jgi:hypothetical protein